MHLIQSFPEKTQGETSMILRTKTACRFGSVRPLLAPLLARHFGANRLAPKTNMTKWTQTCDAAKKLEKLFKMNKIGTKKPGEVWDSDPVFQKYPKANFRTNFNKLKSKLGKLTDEAEEEAKCMYCFIDVVLLSQNDPLMLYSKCFRFSKAARRGLGW